MIIALLHDKTKLNYQEVAMALRSEEFWKMGKEEVSNKVSDELFLEKKSNASRNENSWNKQKTSLRCDD